MSECYGMSPEDYNREQFTSGAMTIEDITEMVRGWQDRHDLEVDGYAGPLTLSTIEAVLAAEVEPEDMEWNNWDGPLSYQPTSRREIYEQFGHPGGDHLDLHWRKDNIIELHQSHGNRLPGAPSGQYIHIHKDVEPYLREALRRAQVACPDYKIERIGSFNFRHIRRDPRRPLSTHSWGISVDIDRHRNYTKTFTKGQGPVAWDERYMEIWPDGLPEGFVRAFQSCGFAWGSDWDEDGDSHDHTFYDPMHFEWVARDGKVNGV